MDNSPYIDNTIKRAQAAQHRARAAGYTIKSREADYTVKLTGQIKPKITVKLTHDRVYAEPWIKLPTFRTTREEGYTKKSHELNIIHRELELNL